MARGAGCLNWASPDLWGAEVGNRPGLPDRGGSKLRFHSPLVEPGLADFPHPALGQGSTRLDREIAPWGPTSSDLERSWGGESACALSLSFSAATGLLELGSLPSTGVTRLPRSYEPVRHPRRPGLSLARVRLGFRSPPMRLPVSRQLPVCRHAVTITPVGPLGRIVRDEGLSTPRFSPATAAFPVSMAGRLPR